jgi:8-oxo-dGTP pyrophosphatase MutT (NUDIX family)
LNVHVLRIPSGNAIDAEASHPLIYHGSMQRLDVLALSTGLAVDPSPEPAPGERLAAVLALLVMEPELSLVFTRRAADLSRHAGEISFPGGLQDPGENLQHTALREASEEIGLDPAVPRIVGALPTVHTYVSSIVVVPFVGLVDELPELIHDPREIAQVLTYRVSDLLQAESTMQLGRDGERPWRGWAYPMEDSFIWGATGRMLHDLLELLKPVRA